MTVDREKIRQKLQFMRDNLKHLESFQGLSLEEFKDNAINEAAATRMLQITIEAMLDMCAHVIAREGWGLPKSYGEIVVVATRNGLSPPDMEETFKKMARFRNRVVHLYEEVDAEELLAIINSQLEDFRPFMASVVEKYLSEDK